jgi:hypothetical protein
VRALVLSEWGGYTEVMMKALIGCAVLAMTIGWLAGAPANAKGCMKGAIVGGVAGHIAGHHGAVGAAAGCAIGHHEANKHK